MDDRRLLRVQAASGAAFALFVAVHLANMAAAVGGAEAYDGFQQAARRGYQTPLVEVLLVGLPLVVHVAAAVTRLRRSGFRRPPQPLRQRLHRSSGWFLLLVIVGHVLAVRGSSLLFDVYPGFAGLSYSLWWQPWMFHPYYFLLGTCGLYHGLNGLVLAADLWGWRLPAALRSDGLLYGVTLAGAAVFVVAQVSLAGGLEPVADPTSSDYARLMNELVGAPLSR